MILFFFFALFVGVHERLLFKVLSWINTILVIVFLKRHISIFHMLHVYMTHPTRFTTKRPIAINFKSICVPHIHEKYYFVSCIFLETYIVTLNGWHTQIIAKSLFENSDDPYTLSRGIKMFRLFTKWIEIFLCKHENLL